jgi:hypothetical protein
MMTLEDRIRAATAVKGQWTLAQVFTHCAQSIEYSLSGYPKPASVLVRKIFGPRVMRKFLAQGFMKHNLAAPVPGAPALDEPDVERARTRLLAALEKFRAASSTAPHFAYGPVSHADYARLHEMHVVEHLGAA